LTEDVANKRRELVRTLITTVV